MRVGLCGQVTGMFCCSAGRVRRTRAHTSDAATAERTALQGGGKHCRGQEQAELVLCDAVSEPERGQGQLLRCGGGPKGCCSLCPPSNAHARSREGPLVVFKTRPPISSSQPDTTTTTTTTNSPTISATATAPCDRGRCSIPLNLLITRHLYHLTPILVRPGARKRPRQRDRRLLGLIRA